MGFLGIIHTQWRATLAKGDFRVKETPRTLLCSTLYPRTTSASASIMSSIFKYEEETPSAPVTTSYISVHGGADGLSCHCLRYQAEGKSSAWQQALGGLPLLLPPVSFTVRWQVEADISVATVHQEVYQDCQFVHVSRPSISPSGVLWSSLRSPNLHVLCHLAIVNWYHRTL